MTPLKPSLYDRFLASTVPAYASRRYRARLAFSSLGQYAGARSDRSALKSWRTSAGSADTDSLGDLNALRSRSRDLVRNNPIATGARATSKSNVVGTGLKFRSKVDRELLGLTEEAAEKWERRTEKLFHLWAKSRLADISRTQNFYQLQGLVFSSTFESGDTFVLRRRPKDQRAIAPLALQVVEADRVCTPVQLEPDDFVRAGVRIDYDGAPVSYFVMKEHPAESAYNASTDDYWEVPAFGSQSGEQMVLHVYDRLRPGMTRGIPALAPVIETLKQLDRYSEAELMKAVVSSFFTVFIKTAGNDGLASATAPLPGMTSNEITMGPGSVIDIDTNEDIQVAQPAQTAQFDPFFQAVVRQIGVALSIPFEVLMMHFTASYSASRAALEMASQFFKERREWLVTTLCDPVFEWFLSDAVAAGLIEAPGFFGNPVRRAAWLGGLWIGPARMVLDPGKEWKAEETAVNMGAKTLEQVIIEKTGGEFETTTSQRGKEHAVRAALKLEPETLTVDGSTYVEPAEPAAPGGST